MTVRAGLIDAGYVAGRQVESRTALDDVDIVGALVAQRLATAVAAAAAGGGAVESPRESGA